MTSKKVRKPVSVAVAIDSVFIDQYLTLPPRWVSFDGRYEFTLVDALRCWVANSEPVFNADLVIHSGYQSGTYFNELLSQPAGLIPSQVKLFPRLGKQTQQVLMRRAAQLLELKSFYSIPTFASSNIKHTNSSWGYLPDGRYVIKPDDGARGCGHMVVTVGNEGILQVTLAEILADLKSVRDSLGDTSQYQPWIDSLVKYDPHIELYMGHGDMDRGLSELRTQKICLQRMVEGVAREWRVLVNHDCSALHFFERTRDDCAFDETRKTAGYKQATGQARRPEEIKMLSQAQVKKLPFYEEVLALVKRLNLRMNSIDLFQTADGSWGVFEFCNQWGTSGMDPQWLHRFLTESLIGLYNENNLK